jgi:hypothetical protein
VREAFAGVGRATYIQLAPALLPRRHAAADALAPVRLAVALELAVGRAAVSACRMCRVWRHRGILSDIDAAADWFDSPSCPLLTISGFATNAAVHRPSRQSENDGAPAATAQRAAMDAHSLSLDDDVYPAPSETSKHEKMARWQRVCILRETARDFNVALAKADHPAVNHAANQRDYILTELPPPVAAAINAEVRPVLHRECVGFPVPSATPPACLPAWLPAWLPASPSLPDANLAGTRDLYRKRVGNNTELFAAVRPRIPSGCVR